MMLFAANRNVALSAGDNPEAETLSLATGLMVIRVLGCDGDY